MRDAFDTYGNWLLDGRGKMPPLVKLAEKQINRLSQAEAATVDPTVDMAPLTAYAELKHKAGTYSKRAKIRHQIADYIEREILSGQFDEQLYFVPAKLRNARKSATWGGRANGKPVIIWDDKSGLTRLDPDEAREETMRLSARYKPHLVNLAGQGKRLYYAVFTMRNFPAGQLGHGKRLIFNRFKNFLRKRHLGKPLFPEIAGALVVQEDPMGKSRDWNVHLNVLFVVDGYLDYGRVRRAWNYDLHITRIEGDPESLGNTFNELVKYSCQVVAEKSAGKTAAPAMTEWSRPEFMEWWNAQKGFKRTRTYGCLYGSKVPHPEPESLDDVTWYGVCTCGPDGFTVTLPPINLIPGDNFAKGSDYFDSTGPPFH